MLFHGSVNVILGLLNLGCYSMVQCNPWATESLFHGSVTNPWATESGMLFHGSVTVILGLLNLGCYSMVQ